MYFDTDMLGSATGGDGTKCGFFFAEDHSHAQYWADRASCEQGGKARVIEVELGHENPAIYDMEELNQSDRSVYLDDLLQAAIDNGHDSAIISNMRDDESGVLRTTVVIFDADLISITN